MCTSEITETFSASGFLASCFWNLEAVGDSLVLLPQPCKIYNVPMTLNLQSRLLTLSLNIFLTF